MMHVRRCLLLQAKWRERQDAARLERLARRQAGQQSDAVSNSTAAHSRSTARPLGSARPLQSGAEPPAEPVGQEAQSARVSLLGLAPNLTPLLLNVICQHFYALCWVDVFFLLQTVA